MSLEGIARLEREENREARRRRQGTEFKRVGILGIVL
jgi:hypothetical protein